MRYNNDIIAKVVHSFVLLIVCLGCSSRAQMPTDILVTAHPAKIGEHGQGNGREETWVHKITLENTTFKNWVDLDVRYRIYQYTELNANHTPASPVTFQEGKLPPAALKSRDKTDLKTGEMNFAFGTSHVDAAREIFQGIWVRVFSKEGKELGSFVKPSSLSTKMPWGEPNSTPKAR